MSTSYSKCPTCGAELKYNPQTNSLKCEFCDSEFDPEEIGDVINQGSSKSEAKETEASEATDETEGKLVSYKCSFCGAEVVTAEDTSATFCVYCHRPLVIDSQLSGEFRPHKLIPFETTKEDAINGFKEYTKKKVLLHKNFKDEVNIQKIMGVYIPFWLLDCLVYEEMAGEGRKIKTWRNGNYRYKKTDYYDVVRKGSVSFENIPADASTKVDDNIMDSIEPFDFSKLKDFNRAYLNGFLAQSYDLKYKDLEERLFSRIQKSTEKLIDGTCNYDGAITKSKLDFFASNEEYKYALLPVWLLYTEYKGNFYPFAMNGQTGKFIGNLPVDQNKAALWGLGSFFAPFTIMAIISLIL